MVIRSKISGSRNRSLQQFLRDSSGATAIEFAFVAPIFFLFVFATLEIALIVLYSSVVNDAGAEAAHYLRRETMKCTRQGSSGNNCTAASTAGLRTTVCGAVSKIGLSCAAGTLKIAAYSADDLVTKPVSSTAMIDNVSLDLASSRAYIVAIGYDWPFVLPTSKLLLPNDGTRVQIQSRVYASTAEKALR